MLSDRIGGRVYATDMKCAKGKDRWDFGGQWAGKFVYFECYTLILFTVLGNAVQEHGILARITVS